MVAAVSAGLLSEILKVEAGAASSLAILQRFSNVNKLSLLQQLLDINKQKDDIKRVDGTNYGCPNMGYYDLPLLFL